MFVYLSIYIYIYIQDFSILIFQHFSITVLSLPFILTSRKEVCSENLLFFNCFFERQSGLSPASFIASVRGTVLARLFCVMFNFCAILALLSFVCLPLAFWHGCSWLRHWSLVILLPLVFVMRWHWAFLALSLLYVSDVQGLQDAFISILKKV